MSDEVTWTVEEIAANQTTQSISSQQANPRYILREFGRRGREILPDVITAKYGDLFQLTACIKDANGADVCDTQTVVYEVDTPSLVMPFACNLEFGAIAEVKTNSYSMNIKNAFLASNAQESCVGDKPFTFIVEVAGSKFSPKSEFYRINPVRDEYRDQFLYIRGPAKEDGCPDWQQQPVAVLKDGTVTSLETVFRDASELEPEIKDILFGILKQMSGGIFTAGEFDNMDDQIAKLSGSEIVQYIVGIPLFASQLAPAIETIIDEEILRLEGTPDTPLTFEKLTDCVVKVIKDSIKKDEN